MSVVSASTTVIGTVSGSGEDEGMGDHPPAGGLPGEPAALGVADGGRQQGADEQQVGDR